MSDLALLEKRIRRTAIQDAGIAVVVFAMAPVTLLAAWSTTKEGITGRTAMMGFFGLVFFWVAWVMFDAARALWPAQESTVYKELSGDGNGIAWSHLTTGSLSAIKVYFVDGTLCTLYAGKRDAEALLNLVGQRAPRAILGFGPEQEAAYCALVDKRRADARSAPEI
ncbi:MAG: hypothetical protein Q8N23_11520 [Archangium sp.]|nr:hypothetical protein [Archangium sp.]MDP3153294.1 hypothetical protein [Archangium sp.]MDP3569615.1 hypothetical protein [Archangium sp.]